ncbi:MAG: hypothetical protein R3C05_00425 [Pirellulaceae bacterium]
MDSLSAYSAEEAFVAMIWFYAWCAFLAFVLFSIPIAALMDKRAESVPASRRKRSVSDDEGVIMGGEDEQGLAVVDEAEMAEDVEMADDVEFADEAVEVGDFDENK